MRKGHPLATQANSRGLSSRAANAGIRHRRCPGSRGPKLAEKGHSRRFALTVPNLMMALAQLAESDLIATLPRHLVKRHAARFHLVTRAVPISWTPDPVRVIASQAAMADPGISWLFKTIARSIGVGKQSPSVKAMRSRK
jgi:DNA-binding transcriptional LysR family regulator